MPTIQLEIKGLEKVLDKLGKIYPAAIPYFQAAGEQSFKGVVLRSPGTPGNYPPAGPGNKPRFAIGTRRALSYYQRGVGSWYPRRSIKNLGAGGFGPVTRKAVSGYGPGGYVLKPTSQRMGTRYSNTSSKITHQEADTYFSALATYSPNVIGDTQKPYFAQVGWRKLFDVLKEKLPDITKVYGKWLGKALEAMGLK